MTWIEFWKNFEKIDNEQINDNLNKLQDFIDKRSENQKVLDILNNIDSTNPDKDIDMSYNPYDKKYYIKINWEINPKWLILEELITKFWTTKNKLENNNIEESLLNQISEIYEELQKKPNKSLEQKVQILKEQYYNKTWFPVPFNRNQEMFTPLD